MYRSKCIYQPVYHISPKTHNSTLIANFAFGLRLINSCQEATMHELEQTSSTPQRRTNFLTPNHPEWSRLNFPHRLHHLLAAMEVEGLNHIAHWDEHGLCFKIRKSDELIQNYLPFFFQQRKWKSFQRVSDHLTTSGYMLGLCY